MYKLSYIYCPFIFDEERRNSADKYGEVCEYFTREVTVMAMCENLAEKHGEIYRTNRPYGK